MVSNCSPGRSSKRSISLSNHLSRNVNTLMGFGEMDSCTLSREAPHLVTTPVVVAIQSRL